MKVQVTEAGEWRRTLEVEVPGDDLQKRFDAAFKEYSKSLNLPGFRKGKIPVSVVRKRFGKAIQGEVLQNAMQEFYQEASKSEGLHPVSEADIEDVDFQEGEHLRFKATFDIKPDLKVDNHKGLKVTRPIAKVKQEHIDQHLEYLRNQNAAEQQVERPASVGDMLVADIHEVDEAGAPIEGRSQEDRSFLIGGPDGKTNDLDEQLLGIEAGEERSVSLTHSEEDQEGREVRFTVKAKEVRERQLPDLDEEFAKDLGDYESLDQLKARVRESFETQADHVAKQRLQENIVGALIRENEFEVPESMVENYLDSVVERARKEHEGHDHDMDEEEIRKTNREGASRGIRRYLLLEAIAAQEAIAVTDEDEKNRIDNMAGNYNIDGDRMRQMLLKSGQLDRIRSELLEEKTLDFLAEQADVEDVEVEEPAEAAQGV
jgi:trigger factor